MPDGTCKSSLISSVWSKCELTADSATHGATRLQTLLLPTSTAPSLLFSQPLLCAFPPAAAATVSSVRHGTKCTLMQKWVSNGRAGSWAAHQDNRKGYRQASRCCQSQARSEEGCKEEIKTQEDARIGSNASARQHYLQFLFPEGQQRVCREIPLIMLDLR